MASIFLALGAAAGFGIGDFFGGFAAKRGSALAVTFVSQAIGLSLMLVVAPLLGGEPDVSDWLWGASAGLGGGLGLTALFRGLADGVMSIVAPVTSAIAAAFPVTFALATGERPGAVAMLGVALALIATFVLAYEPGSTEKLGKGVTLGILAGLGFGFFFIFISQVGDDSGLYPLVAARMSSIPLVGVLLLWGRRRNPVRWPPLGLTAASGVLDQAANVFFLLGIRTGLLTVVAAITALAPAGTLAMARAVLGERLRPLQWGGVALALVAVVLLAVS